MEAPSYDAGMSRFPIGDPLRSVNLGSTNGFRFGDPVHTPIESQSNAEFNISLSVTPFDPMNYGLALQLFQQYNFVLVERDQRELEQLYNEQHRHLFARNGIPPPMPGIQTQMNHVGQLLNDECATVINLATFNYVLSYRSLNHPGKEFDIPPIDEIVKMFQTLGVCKTPNKTTSTLSYGGYQPEGQENNSFPSDPDARTSLTQDRRTFGVRGPADVRDIWGPMIPKLRHLSYVDPGVRYKAPPRGMRLYFIVVAEPINDENKVQKFILANLAAPKIVNFQENGQPLHKRVRWVVRPWCPYPNRDGAPSFEDLETRIVDSTGKTHVYSGYYWYVGKVSERPRDYDVSQVKLGATFDPCQDSPGTTQYCPLMFIFTDITGSKQGFTFPYRSF